MSEAFISPLDHQPLGPSFGLPPDMLVEGMLHDSGEWRIWEEPCQVPQDCAHLHSPFLVSSWWRRVLGLVREPVLEPVRERATAEGRQLLVLGSVVLDIAGDGQITAQLWVEGPGWVPRLVPLEGEEVALQGMPYRMLWLNHLRDLAVIEVRRHLERHGLADDAEGAVRYAAAVFEGFARRLPRHADLRQMRERIAVAIGWDRSLLSMAARVPVTTQSRSIVTLAAYNLVLRHRAALEQLQHEAPALVPIYAAVCEREDFPGQGEVQQRLRGWMTEVMELKPALWRHLRLRGARALVALAQVYSGPVELAAVEHLKLLNGWNLQTLPPSWAVETLLKTLGDPGNRWRTYVSDSIAGRRPWGQLLRLAHGLNDAPHRREEFALIARWIARPGLGWPLTSDQCRAGWGHLLQEAQAWERDEREQHRLASKSWTPGFAAIYSRQYSLEPIATGADLWEEAVAMRHCVDTFAYRCEDGECVLFSLRHLGRRVATVELVAEGSKWCLEQARSKFNGSLTSAQLAALRRLLSKAPAPPEEVDPEALRKQARLEAGLSEEDEDEETEEAPVQVRIVEWLYTRDRHRVGDFGTLTAELAEWLEHLNDTGGLDYNYSGNLIGSTQVENWRYDLDTWLDRAEAGEWIPKARIRAARRHGESALNMRNFRVMSEKFVETMLAEGELDMDVYPGWHVQRLQDHQGREAWALFSIKGYSFTSVQLRLKGVTKNLEGVAGLLDEEGYWSCDKDLRGISDGILNNGGTSTRDDPSPS